MVQRQCRRVFVRRKCFCRLGKFRREQAHPSLQVQGYHYDLKETPSSVFTESPAVNLDSCAYCHNYSRLASNPVLFSPKFSKDIEKFPLFAKEDVQALGTYLGQRLATGDGFDAFGRFIASTVRPSRKLLEHTSEMINKQQIFNLIDDQIAAYNAIMHRAKNGRLEQKEVYGRCEGRPRNRKIGDRARGHGRTHEAGPHRVPRHRLKCIHVRCGRLSAFEREAFSNSSTAS